MKKKLVTLCLIGAMALTAVGGSLAYFTDTTETVKNTFTVGKVDITLDEIDLDGTGENPRTEEGNDYTEKIMPGVSFAKDPTITLEAGSEESYVFLDMTMNQYKSLFPVMAQDAIEYDKKADEAEGIGYTEDMFKACMKDSDTNDNTPAKFSSQTFLTQLSSNPAIFRKMIDRWFIGIDHDKWQLCEVFYNCAEDDVTKSGNFLTFRFAYIESTEGGADEFDYVVGPADTDVVLEPFMTNFQMPITVTQDMVGNEKAGVNAFDTVDNNGEIAPFKLNFKAYAIQADIVADADTSDDSSDTELNTLAKAYKAMFDRQLPEELGLTIPVNN